MRIAVMLRERITAGDLAPAQPAPSITRLRADHGVARQTAAHALGAQRPLAAGQVELDLDTLRQVNALARGRAAARALD